MICNFSTFGTLHFEKSSNTKIIFLRKWKKTFNYFIFSSKSRLIVGEVKCVFWTSMFVAIIYIEDKLFIHGRSVFGLFSAVCLFMACLQIYFWILVLVILISIYVYHFAPKRFKMWHIFVWTFFRVCIVNMIKKKWPRKNISNYTMVVIEFKVQVRNPRVVL